MGSARTQNCHPKRQRTGRPLGHKTAAQGGVSPSGRPSPTHPQPRTISRWVDEAEEPEAVVLPLGGHSQLLHRGACLGAATSGVKARAPPGGAAPPRPRRTHVREQREVQVPPQVAHGAPAPVLEHVQVHLPLVLRGARAYPPRSGPRPRGARPAAHLLAPRGRLVGEVKRGRSSGPPRKQRVRVPTFQLQEKRYRVEAEPVRVLGPHPPPRPLTAPPRRPCAPRRGPACRASCPRAPHSPPEPPRPQPCSPPAPPHGSRWSPLPSAWPAQPGRLRRLSHWSASRHLWVAHGV